MIRKFALALVAFAAIGGASLAITTSPADAAPKGFHVKGHGGHGHGGGGAFRPHRPHFGHGHWRPHRPHWNFHAHWRRPVYVARPYIRYVRPAVTYAAAPTYAAPVRNNCTCLTKEYTTDGLVVFRDLCTTETASAQVPGAQPSAPPQQSGEAASPNNFAGRSYQDFLAANGQGTQAPRQN